MSPMDVRRASLDAAQRAADLEALAGGVELDLLVVGGGVVGAGVAVDAASRGLRVALVERTDLAFGTSRWSSKMIHGGLRYIATGDIAVAYESTRERAVLMDRIAPHLIRPLPMVVPMLPSISRTTAMKMRAGLGLAEALRLAARTGLRTLPGPRHLTRAETIQMIPAVRHQGLRGGLLYWEGQLEDDARLVVALARTAAGYGVRVVTRCAALRLAGDGARLRDQLSGEELDVRARMVINATGVWAHQLAPQIRLRPSKGVHVVVRASSLGGLSSGLTIPVPGQRHRFVFALPTTEGRVYVGLTDDPVDGEPPDEPPVEAAEVEFLVRTISEAFSVRLTPADVIGAYAGLRPLVDSGGGSTADLSRRHSVITGEDGVVTVVGGKLTTYRRMAEDAVDAALRGAGVSAGRCVTERLGLVGAAPPRQLDRVAAPRRLVERYGTEAERVLAGAGGDAGLLAPIAPGIAVTGAELRFGLRHEGALTADDLLQRRTRIGLVPAELEAVRPAVERLVAAELGAAGPSPAVVLA